MELTINNFVHNLKWRWQIPPSFSYESWKWLGKFPALFADKSKITTGPKWPWKFPTSSAYKFNLKMTTEIFNGCELQKTFASSSFTSYNNNRLDEIQINLVFDYRFIRGCNISQRKVFLSFLISTLRSLNINFLH